MLLFTFSISYLFYIGSVNSFEDLDDLKDECKKTKGYPASIIEKECKEPVIFEFPRINWGKSNCQKNLQPLPPVCLSVAELTLEFTYHQDISRTQNKRPEPLFLLHMVNGLLRIQQELQVELSTALTSPFELVKKYDPNDPDLKLYSEVSISEEVVKEITVDNYFNVLGVLHIYLPELSLWHGSDESTSVQKMNILIYYDSNLIFIPTTKHILHEDKDFRRYHPTKKKDKRSIESIVVNTNSKYYQNYQRLVNMRDSKAPWVDDYHRHAERHSLWCRGHRFIMAIFDPLLRWEKLNRNGKDTEWYHDNTLNGPRYCSVTVVNETAVYLQMFLSHKFRKMEEKPSVYAIQVFLERAKSNDWYFPKFSALRLAFKNPPGSDRYGYEKKASTEYVFKMEGIQSKTHYSVGSQVYVVNNDFDQLREEVEIGRLAIEFNLNGVPEMFSEEYIIDSRLFALKSSSVVAESRRIASSRWLAAESSSSIGESRWIESSHSIASESSLLVAESRRVASARSLYLGSSLSVARKEEEGSKSNKIGRRLGLESHSHSLAIAKSRRKASSRSSALRLSSIAESRRQASSRSIASKLLSAAESLRKARRLRLERRSRSVIAESRRQASSRSIASWSAAALLNKVRKLRLERSSRSIAAASSLSVALSRKIAVSRLLATRSSQSVVQSRWLASSQSLASASSLSEAKLCRVRLSQEFMSKSSSVVAYSRFLASSQSLASGSSLSVAKSRREGALREFASKSSSLVQNSRWLASSRSLIVDSRGAALSRKVARRSSLSTRKSHISGVMIRPHDRILYTQKYKTTTLHSASRGRSEQFVNFALRSLYTTTPKISSIQNLATFMSKSLSPVRDPRFASYRILREGNVDRKVLSRKFRSSSSSIVKESRQLASQSLASMQSSRNVEIQELQQNVAASRSRGRYLEQQQYNRRSKDRKAENQLRRDRFQSKFKKSRWGWLILLMILGVMVALVWTLVHILRSKIRKDGQTSWMDGMGSNRSTSTYMGNLMRNIFTYIVQGLAFVATFNIMYHLKEFFLNRRRPR